jgi:ABC-2 type transport system permease protein
MRVYLTLVRRELGSFFVSLTGYVVIALVALLLGLSFTILLEALNKEATDIPITDLFYTTFYFWLILLLSAPVITMRAFALEKYSGTYETLMTAPVSDLAVVLAKFTSALLFYCLMWLPLLACIFVVRHYSNDPGALDPGPIASTYLGILLVGALFMALGCFASALTRSQIIAAMTTFAIGIALFLVSFLSLIVPPQPGWQTTLISQLAMLEHMQEFVRGVVDTRFVVFYLSLTFFFLFLTLKVVESRRWK